MEVFRNADAAFMARARYEGEGGLQGLPTQTPEMKAAVESSIAARTELAKTAPTTLAGLVAYLDFVLAESDKLSSEGFPECLFAGEEEILDFVRSLPRSARALAAQA